MKIAYAPLVKMPKKCTDCPLFDCHYDYFSRKTINDGCRLYSYGIPARYNYDAETKPEWCELIEIEE